MSYVEGKVSSHSGTANILLVDDDPDMRQATVRLLRKSGYAVAEANNGSECLDLAGRLCPDLILLDVVLPDIDGKDVCRQLKKNPDLFNTAVVLLSGKDTHTDQKAIGIKVGANDYIARPVGNKELLARVDLILQMRNQRLEIQESERKYHQLFENMMNGFALHEIICDDEGCPIDYRFLDVNPAFERLTGLTSETILGKTVLEVMPNTERYWIERYGRVAISGEPIEFENFSREVDRYFLVMAYRPAPQQFACVFQDITDRKNSEKRVKKALEISESREREVAALLKGARAVLELDDFQTIARNVFDLCCEVIGAQSGYVALLSDDGQENEVLFLEAGGLPCDVDPELPMPIRGLRSEAYRSQKTVYDNDFMKSDWADFMPPGHVVLENVMFAPLVISGKTVGVIGLANKPEDYNDNDAKIATGFGEQAAIALQNSKNLDERIAAEKQREKVILDLNNALSEVKKLSGLLPICSHCKKIRDGKGYWNQIEEYIQGHSEAQFSHSICKECAEKYYSDMNLYGNE